MNDPSHTLQGNGARLSVNGREHAFSAHRCFYPV
ncbi:Uncharacterised protein [Vibrio cholerae]|nr:Uncharacterised protein [Vibrio cholerae]